MWRATAPYSTCIVDQSVQGKVKLEKLVNKLVDRLQTRQIEMDVAYLVVLGLGFNL